MVAPDYAAHRSALAVKIGLGHKRNTDATVVAPIVAEKPKRGRKKTAG
jgi:predicted transcriptional regulator